MQAMSMSQRAAQGAALDFATFGSAAGLTGQKLAGFSMKLTEVAADAASFYAVTPQQMIEDMGSAFAGQSRPMQKYGVLLQENTLKQTAFNHGITDSIRDLSQTERIKTVYVAMLDQLAVTQGDVARTSEAFGNKLKRLQGRFEEVSAGIGQKMMPLAKAFVDLLAGPGLSVLAGFGSALGVVVKVLTTAGSAFAGLPAPIQAAVAAVVGLQLAQRLLGTQMATAGSHITGMANAVRNFSPIITSASDRMRGISAGMSGVVTTSRYGQVAIGQFGAQIQRIGNHVPIVARMQTAFMNAAVEANRFPRAAGAAAAGMTAVRGAASGLMGALGGPWGAAIMGATVLLGLFISQKQKDKQASQEAAAATASWSDQLVASGGKMTSALRNDIAKAVQDSSKKIQFAGNDTRKLADAMREVGISSKDAVDAISGNAEAWDRVRAKLKAYQEQHGQGRADMFVEDDMTKALAELGDQYGAATTRAAELAKVNRDTAVSFDNTAEAAGVMTTAMVEFEESTDGAASKVEKLVKALDQLNQDSQTQEEALQEWNDAIRDFTEQYEAAGAAVVDAGGNIDTTTKAGSELREKMEDQASAFNQVGAAAYEYAQSMGMDVASSLDYVRDKLVAQRKSFVDAAVGMGMPIEKANALADAYGMIPERIVTQLNVQGMEYALSGLNALGVKAQALPVGNLKIVENTSEVRAKLDEMKIKYAVIDGKVVIDTNSPEVIRAMEALGVKVETLPNGYVQLDDNSPAVMQKLNDLGIKTQTLPNGKIVINPEDAAFWEAVRKAQEPGQKNIVVNYVDSNGNTTARGLGSSGVPMSEEFLRKNRAVPQNATGGPIVGPGTKTSDSVLMWGSNGEFVQQASAVDYYGPGFMHALNQRQIPKSALPGFATGGLIEVHDLAQYVTGIESGTYGLGNWGDGWNTDCSGGQSIAVNAVHGNMQPGTGERAGTAAFSTFLPSHGYTIGTAPSGVAAHEVGWSIEHTAGTLYGKSGASVNFEMGGGMDNTTFSDGKYGGTVGSRHSQFSDHAYIILPDNYGAGSGGTPANADITLTADSSRDDVAKKIIAEGRKRGYTDEQITAVLSTGIQESNLDPKAQGGGGAWHGVFQQDESYDGRDDPNTNITGFYDKLDEKKKSEGWSEDMWSNIFWLQQAPGAESAEAAVANGRAEYLDEIKSKQSEAGTMLSTLGPSISTGSASEFPGGTGGTGTTDTTSSTTETEPPDDPTLFDFTIRNPFEPFWWKGEKKYRDHVIDEYKKQKEWDEYWSGTGSGGSSTAATASSIAAAESSLEEAKRNVAEATEKQRIAEMKLEEVKANPKSKPSQIASAEQSVVKAKNDVTQANEKQHTAELKLQELRAKGTTSTGKGTGRSGTGKSKGKTTSRRRRRRSRQQSRRSKRPSGRSKRPRRSSGSQSSSCRR
nr:hypothetical protein [Gordonia sp. NB41Y]